MVFRKYLSGNLFGTPHLVFLFLFVCQFFLQADIRYVSKTGTSTPPYLTWETAADSIQKAVDICDNGDTIIVANGTYYESLYIIKTITLLGSSADSTVIRGNGTAIDIILFDFGANSCVLKNFYIKGPGININEITGIYMMKASVTVSDCRFSDIFNAIRPFYSSAVVENVFISNARRAIYDECPNDTCNSIYRNNVIISTGSTEPPVMFEGGGYPTFTNNIMIDEGENWRGLGGAYLRGFIIKNNLISGYQTEGIFIGLLHNDSAYIINNTLINNCWDPIFGGGTILTVLGVRTHIKNNIIVHSLTGIYSENDTAMADYNLLWDVKYLTRFKAKLRDSNIVADPMFVRDTVMGSGNYDFHLQKYSPAIDKGDPSILDRDGTRSDLGMFGGPGGEEYTYMDLSPRAPVNFTATVTSDSIKLKWKRNSESDTSYYSVYMDSTADFMIDSTKIISKQTDTLYTYLNPKLNKHYYFKVTATDKQGNQSHPSEEIHVVITSTNEKDYPVEISDYKLYQNYPNPFNPTTKIGYRLKQKGYVKLLVYDIKGERIKELVNKEQEQGYYEIDFNGSDLASQILLYRIEVISEGNIPAYSNIKKMMFLK